MLFNKTIFLDQDSIVDFVKALCEISREELAHNNRIFSLQKLVEVAEFNMTRIRLEWSKIWNIISEHLTEVGSNNSPVIAEKAVDSLRQLAKKFLQKDEISVYHFQKEFLKPFENILINNMNVYRTKEYVITCIANLVLAEATSIKSGWRIIFNIFQLAAEDSSPDIIRKTFDTIVKIFQNHFSQVKENFPELAHCLKKYSNNYPEECINLYMNSFTFLDDINHIFAVFSCMSIIMRDSRENIRKISSNILFGMIIKVNKNFICNDYWKQIFQSILNPVIETLVTMKFSSTLELVLFEICDLIYKFYDSLDFLLNDFLKVLTNILISENESIALSGIEALKHLIYKLNNNSNTEFWESIILTVSEIFIKTKQNELLDLDIKNFDKNEFNIKYQEVVNHNIVFCIIQHHLIELCEYLIENFMYKINISDINFLLDRLKDSYELAYQFNIEFELRKMISLHFMSDLNQIAALFKQQQDGTALYFGILVKIYNSEYDSNTKLACKKKILINSRRILDQFISRMKYNEKDLYLDTENDRLINNMVPTLINHIVPALVTIEFVNEKEYLEDFTKIFIELIACNILELRLKIKEMFLMIFDKMKLDRKY